MNFGGRHRQEVKIHASRTHKRKTKRPKEKKTKTTTGKGKRARVERFKLLIRREKSVSPIQNETNRYRQFLPLSVYPLIQRPSISSQASSSLSNSAELSFHPKQSTTSFASSLRDTPQSGTAPLATTQLIATMLVVISGTGKFFLRFFSAESCSSLRRLCTIIATWRSALWSGERGSSSLKEYLGVPIFPPVGFIAVYFPHANPPPSGLAAKTTIPSLLQVSSVPSNIAFLFKRLEMEGRVNGWMNG